MLKQLKTVLFKRAFLFIGRTNSMALLVVLTLLGTGLASCQKEMLSVADPTASEAVQVRNSYLKSAAIKLDDDLLQKMAANENVQLLFRDSYNFAADYENAIRSMSNDKRRSYFASQQGVARLSPSTDYLVRTASQMADFYASQLQHTAEMKRLFPAYNKMDDSEQAAFTSKLVRVIVQGGESALVGGSPCASGYSACMGSCGGSGGSCGDGCWAGLKACLAVMYPAP